MKKLIVILALMFAHTANSEIIVSAGVGSFYFNDGDSHKATQFSLGYQHRVNEIQSVEISYGFSNSDQTI